MVTLLPFRERLTKEIAAQTSKSAVDEDNLSVPFVLDSPERARLTTAAVAQPVRVTLDRKPGGNGFQVRVAKSSRRVRPEVVAAAALRTLAGTSSGRAGSGTIPWERTRRSAIVPTITGRVDRSRTARTPLPTMARRVL